MRLRQIRSAQVSRKEQAQKILSEAVLNDISDIAFAGLESRQADECQLEALASCFERLNASDQNLLYRRYQSDETVEVIASDFSKTPRAVYKQLANIRRTLKHCIEYRLSYEAKL